MNTESNVVCLNLRHETIVTDYLRAIQSLMDRVTNNDDDYDHFLSVLAQIIEIHNQQGISVYKDPLLREEWFYSLPNMVYWACLGYLCGLELKVGDIEKITLKMSKILIKTMTKLETMTLISPNPYGDNTLLN
jgi:hypothetical protein